MTLGLTSGYGCYKKAVKKSQKSGPGKINRIHVKCAQPVDRPSSHAIAENYVLIGPKEAVVTGFTSAVYSPNSEIVVLTLKKMISIKKLAKFKMTVLQGATMSWL